MSDESVKTLRTLRLTGAGDGNTDRNVWSGAVETGEFELVSTMMLKCILVSDDDKAKQQIEAVAKCNVEGGLLAHDTINDSYEIVEGEANDDLELVSTLMLKRILEFGDAGDVTENPLDTDGIDPYDCG